ncbi:glycosyltransferase family A protein [Algoriphagus sp. NG3]|uniref:glycosyltransferase family 2 protein n=1 Tax=Algoriphagus sp. NG3 TaxID=3097546 RepID=UPI002A82AB3A|nr:glycosyltransferase family A protein [Algoriphagus sp. NG3]WPR77400.1 glycosyltransferase family A protein [Algoriphagus sp. NG3]
MYFSVIVPTYREREKLYSLLEALAEQSFNAYPWEVIIVNNDPESCLSISQNLFFPFKILNELQPGSYHARNKGIVAAKGEIIAFIDSDCAPDANWLSNAWKFFSKDFKKEIGILTGPVPLFFKDPKSLSDAEVYEKYTGFTTEAYAKEGHAITANWFSPASVIKEFGGFNGKLKSNGDSELSGRISKKYRIVYSPSLIVHHPARYLTEELVNKYKRLMGGTFARRFEGRNLAFLKYVLDFIFRRYRFFIKRLFTLPLKESMALWRVCNAINYGVMQEYFNLINGGETKR